tara:strand:- start:71 stop:331 length:261 start_codon:yes stop_codon:yes gene_type:complete
MSTSKKVKLSKEEHKRYVSIAAPYVRKAVEFAEMTDMLTFKSWAQAPQMFEDYVGMPYDKMAMLVNSGFIAEDVLNEEVLIYAGIK